MLYSNVTTEIIHWTYNKKAGPKYPVRLRVTYKGDSKYFGSQYGLRMMLTKEEFKATKGNPRGINRERREFLRKYEASVQRIIGELIPFEFSLDDLADKLRGPKKKEKILLSDALIEYGGQAKSLKSKELYEYTAHVVKKVAPRLVVSSVRYESLIRIEDFMYKLKNSESTIAMHMKHIRAVINRSARSGDIAEGKIPFGVDGYVIPKIGHSHKVSTKEDIASLIEFRSKYKKLQLARDVYVFSFFCGGANPVDIFSFKTDNLTDNVLRFKRTKTGVPVEIPMIPLLGEIIGRQQRGRYLFPIVKKDFRKDCKSARRIINDRLKKILGKPDVSLARARNSFSTYSIMAGMSVPLVGAMMGHSAKSTTEGYMAFPIHEKVEKLNDLKNYFTK